MSEAGDCRRLHRERYHKWLKQRWQQRAKAAAEKRERELKQKGGRA